VLPTIDVGAYSPQPSETKPSTPTRDTTPVSCDAAVKLALQSAVFQRLERAMAARDTANTRPMSMAGRSELRLRENLSQPDEFRATLRWRPPNPGRSALSAQNTSAHRRGSAAELRRRMANVSAEVRSLHLSVRTARLELDEQERRFEMMKAGVDLDRIAVKAGTLTRAALLRGEAELHQAKFATHAAQHALRLAIARFQIMVGRAPKPGPCSTQTQISQLSEHPEVSMVLADAQQLAIRASERQIESTFWPSFFETSWQRSDKGANNQFLVEIGLPLTNDRNERAEKARGEAQVAASHAQWVAQEIAVRVRMAQSLVTSLERQLADARKSVQSRQKTPPVPGMGSPLDQLKMETLRRQLKSDVMRLSLSLESARIELQRALAIP